MSDSDRPSRMATRLAEDRALEVDPAEGPDDRADRIIAIHVDNLLLLWVIICPVQILTHDAERRKCPPTA